MPTLLTVPEAAQKLRVSPSLLYQLAKAGKVPSVRLGRRLLFSEDGLARAVLAAEQPACAPAAISA